MKYLGVVVDGGLKWKLHMAKEKPCLSCVYQKSCMGPTFLVTPEICCISPSYSSPSGLLGGTIAELA